MLTLLGPQPRFGDQLLGIWVVCPPNGTAVLKGLRRPLRPCSVFFCSIGGICSDLFSLWIITALRYSSTQTCSSLLLEKTAVLTDIAAAVLSLTIPGSTDIPPYEYLGGVLFLFFIVLVLYVHWVVYGCVFPSFFSIQPFYDDIFCFSSLIHLFPEDVNPPL